MPRAKGLAKQRPKKKLVQLIEAAPEAVLTTEEENAGWCPVVPAAAASLAPVPCAAVLSSPDRKELEKAESLRDHAAEELTRMEKVLKHFKAKEKMVQRLFEAKMRRADGVNRKRKLKNPFGVACRRYEAIIALDEAQLKRSFAERATMEAQCDYFAAYVGFLQLEIARLRRGESTCP